MRARHRVGGRVVLRVVLTAVVALLALVPLPAPALQTGADAAQVRPGGRGVTRFEVVDHNVERRQAAVDAAVREAARTQSPVVLLQEVCWWQVAALREAHPTWTVGFKPDRDSLRCRRPLSLATLGDRGRRSSGVAAIWTGGARGVVTSRTFRRQGDRDFRHGMVCVSWRATGTTRRACSVHLLNAARFPSRRGVQVAQGRDVRAWTSPWIRRGDLVVVGGDFNASPGSPTLDPMYAGVGGGRFVEATGCPRSVALCRRSRGTTFDGGATKIDYIFFSANRVPREALHSVRVSRTPSDHHLLSGWAHVDVTGRPDHPRTAR